MRRLLFLLACLVAPWAAAQETYSIAANANQVTDLTAIVSAANGGVCNSLNLALSCTQAQACTAANAPGGSSCTAAQARGANVRIYPQTQAGREEFVLFVIAGPRFAELRASAVPAFSQRKLCDFWATATRTQKDTTCSSVGLPNGCELCP